jgi:peroxiredoxin family protein
VTQGGAAHFHGQPRCRLVTLPSERYNPRVNKKPRFVIFAHNATYDKLHQVATLALTAAAMGKDVIVVLLFWTIKKLASGEIDVVDFPPEYGHHAEEVAALLKEKKVPRISEMLRDAKQVGHFRLIACSAGLEYMGVDAEAVAKNVDEVLGLPAILSLTAGAETTLFI